MKETQQLLHVISQTLSADNGARKDAEQQLAKAQKSNPDTLLLGLCAIVESPEVPPPERLSALIMLRRAVTLNKVVKTAWDEIQDPTKRGIMGSALRTLVQDHSHQFQSHVADLVGNLAASVMEKTGQWPDLTNLLGEWANSPDSVKRQMALKVFTHLTRAKVPLEPFHDFLRQVYIKGMQDSCAEVRVASLKSSVEFLFVEPAFKADLKNAMPHAFATVTGCLNANQEDLTTTTLEVLVNILEILPELVEGCIDAVLDCCFNIASQNTVPETVRHLCLELIVTLGENKPTYLRKRLPFLQKLIHLLLMMMAQIEDNPDWNRGDEYDFEEDEREIGGSGLDRLALSIRAPVAAILFEESYLPSMFQNPEWRVRHTALIAISMVGEGCADVLKQNLDQVMHYIFPCFHDSHERVRWAACNTVGQMATDFHPLLQKRFHQPLITSLIAVMDDTANPRVQSYAAAAVINFCESTKTKIVLPYLEPVLQKLMALTRTPTEVIVEQAITAIAAMADCVGDKFIPFYANVMPTMQAYLTGTGPVDSLKIRAKSIEAIGLIAAAVGLETFRPHSQAIMNVLLELEGSNLPPEDPRKPLLQRAWGRFSAALKEEFAPYLGPILPGVLHSAGLKAQVKLLSEDETEDENWQLLQLDTQNTLGVNTAVIQEKAAAMTLLFWLTYELKGQFYPYVAQIMPICVEGLDFFYNESVRSSASSILPCLLRTTCEVAGQENPEFKQFARDVVGKLLTATENEIYAEVALTFLDNLQECVAAAGPFLTNQEMGALMNTMQKLMQEFTDARQAQLHYIKENEDRADKAQEELENQHEIVVKIGELVGKVLETHGQAFLPHLESTTAFFGNLLAANEFVQEVQISVCYFDDLVEFGTSAAVPIYQSWVPKVVSLMFHPDNDVRQSVVYGLGVLAEKNPTVFSPVMNEVLTGLNNMISAEDSRADQNAHVTENAISAMGKIIQFHGNAINVPSILPVWISYLPVSEDDETSVIYQQLCHFVMTHSGIVLGENQERLPLILALFLEVLGTSLIADETNGIIVSIIKGLQEQLPEKMQAAFQSMPPHLQEKAQHLP